MKENCLIVLYFVLCNTFYHLVPFLLELHKSTICFLLSFWKCARGWEVSLSLFFILSTCIIITHHNNFTLLFHKLISFIFTDFLLCTNVRAYKVFTPHQFSDTILVRCECSVQVFISFKFKSTLFIYSSTLECNFAFSSVFLSLCVSITCLLTNHPLVVTYSVGVLLACQMHMIVFHEGLSFVNTFKWFNCNLLTLILRFLTSKGSILNGKEEAVWAV